MPFFITTDEEGYTHRGTPRETLWRVGEVILPLKNKKRYFCPSAIALAVVSLGSPGTETTRMFRISPLGPDSRETRLVGWTTSEIVVIREVPYPVLSEVQRTEVVIRVLLALGTLTDEWQERARKWLRDGQRTPESWESSERARQAEEQLAWVLLRSEITPHRDLSEEAPPRWEQASADRQQVRAQAEEFEALVRMLEGVLTAAEAQQC